MSTEDRTLAAAMVAIEAVWREVSRTPFVQRDMGITIDRLPDISEAAVTARSGRAADLRAKIDQVDAASLPHDLGTTLAVARTVADRMAREADWYWLAIDPTGVGFFGIFAPTAYCGGFVLSQVSAVLAGYRFDAPGDLDRYLGLMEDYARLIGQMRERTAGQAERGIRMPVSQLDQSIELVARMSSGTGALVPSHERLRAVGGAGAAQVIAERVAQSVDPAWTALATYLADSDYRAAAPKVVGMSQFPRGEEVYAELVKIHTTMALSPAEVHAEGLRRMDAVRQAMDALLKDVGFGRSPEDYRDAVGADPAWRAADADAIAAVFRRYIDRIAPHIEDYFNFKPKADHTVEALPAALSASMTFGYYDAPSADQPVGRYLFNAENLSRNALPNIAALNYHELVPGHHFHLASQRENDALHPLRAHSFVNAFNEGWAEYAATLAGEMGMYEKPEEKFGRLMMDAFLTCRLVVDTGMNALGWSLEQARDYMRSYAFMPEAEVCSESVRYSCDIPGQSLAYKLGEHFLTERREEMRSALGSRFDIRRFHDAVLRPGALPLPLVAKNIERATATDRP